MNHTSLLSLLVTEHQMRTTHLEHKTKQIFCTACLQPSQFSQALRGQMKYPRANCFQIISDHLLMAYAKRDKTEVQRSLFPAHHEVVLNPNIRSAMAVMRCCPGRDVQATALNFGHRGKKNSLPKCIFSADVSTTFGNQPRDMPGGVGLLLVVGNRRRRQLLPRSLWDPRATRRARSSPQWVESLLPAPLAAGLQTTEGFPSQAAPGTAGGHSAVSSAFPLPKLGRTNWALTPTSAQTVWLCPVPLWLGAAGGNGHGPECCCMWSKRRSQSSDSRTEAPGSSSFCTK